jgi:cytochrome P450
VVAGAGNETTTRLIGWAGKVLADNPDQRRKLFENPSLIPNAIEELLRFESPAQMTFRYALEDAEVAGRRIRAGDSVCFALAAANRDPDRFTDPHTLDLARTNNRHLTFGGGIHACLGAALARLEVSTTFEIFASRFPELRIVGEPIRAKGHRLRGFDEFRLVLGRDHG